MPYTVKRSYTYIICIGREKINEKFMKFKGKILSKFLKRLGAIRAFFMPFFGR